MPEILDEGIALFAELNAMPKRATLSENSCRVDPRRLGTVMDAWHRQVPDQSLQPVLQGSARRRGVQRIRDLRRGHALGAPSRPCFNRLQAHLINAPYPVCAPHCLVRSSARHERSGRKSSSLRKFTCLWALILRASDNHRSDRPSGPSATSHTADTRKGTTSPGTAAACIPPLTSRRSRIPPGTSAAWLHHRRTGSSPAMSRFANEAALSALGKTDLFSGISAGLVGIAQCYDAIAALCRKCASPCSISLDDPPAPSRRIFGMYTARTCRITGTSG